MVQNAAIELLINNIIGHAYELQSGVPNSLNNSATRLVYCNDVGLSF